MPLNVQKTVIFYYFLGIQLRFLRYLKMSYMSYIIIVCHTVNNESILLMYTRYNWAYSYYTLVFFEFEYN